MRRFALVVFDIEDNVIDRRVLHSAVEPEGLGWRLSVSRIETDVEDIITNILQSKQDIKLRLVTSGYIESQIISNWIQQYIGIQYDLALEYNDGVTTRYCSGLVTGLSKTELNEYSALNRELTFTPTSPFFTLPFASIRIAVAAAGKSYPFKYPYRYGKNLVENNLIDNPYMQASPITVRFTGTITNPDIRLIDAGSTVYNRVQFPETTLGANEYIVINSGRQKILKYDGSGFVDYAAQTNPLYDTFLRAERGISTMAINIEAGDTCELTARPRRYVLG